VFHGFMTPKDLPWMSGRAGDSRCGGCELGAAACDEAKLESENHITSERQGSQLLVSPNHHSISSSLLQSQLKRHERPSGPAREVGGLGLSVRRMDCCCPGSLVNPAAIPAHLTLASWAAEPAVRSSIAKLVAGLWIESRTPGGACGNSPNNKHRQIEELRSHHDAKVCTLPYRTISHIA
jgi:hypothetical protein